MSKATIRRALDGRWLVAIDGRPPGKKFDTHTQAVDYASRRARAGSTRVKMRGEYRRMRRQLSHEGTVRRLSEGFDMPVRWVREVIADISVHEQNVRS